MQLPRLYKTTATGSIQICDITTTGDTYFVTFGKLDGKLQVKSTVCYSKNLGKANETTPTQQAELEAKAKWVKKYKQNYSTLNDNKETMLFPMRVHKYQEYVHKLDFDIGVYESPKLNGINSEYRLVGGILKHYSRGGEEYPIQEHQRSSVLQVMKQLGSEALNGEQYIHGEFLQDIQSAVTKINPLSSKLIFCLFDIADSTDTYDKNHTKMQSISAPFVVSIESNLVHSDAEVRAKHKLYESLGYEGLIARNAKGKYRYNYRTYDVLKLKTPQDAEFLIISYSLDKNNHPVFTCSTTKGLTFKVKPKELMSTD